MSDADVPRRRMQILIQGAVQGVGFRPFLFRLATELSLAGWARNSPSGVEAEVEGPRAMVESFIERVERDSPPHVRIATLKARFVDPLGQARFEIRDSEAEGERRIAVPPDLAICAECRRELFDPRDRRYRYPFINCTQCGPRYTILTRLPYDRANTSMQRFRMCDRCQAEYDDPSDRRFHAQPNACPACGPHLELWDGQGRRLAAHDDALQAAASAVRQGQIAAVKGLGGFHLMVGAGQEEAVRRLRERKRREAKPLALMFPSMDAVKAECEVSELEARLLTSPAAPIVLLRRRSQAARASAVAPSVAPGSPYLGVMLPYTPLHHLLLAELAAPVVATSGNLSDEPICTEAEEALQRLDGIAALFLMHDRPIVRPVDDSVVRELLGDEVLLRRARGYAPLPLPLGTSGMPAPPVPVLAVGGHLKNTVAISVGTQAVLSQHVGDLETILADAAFRQTAADLQALHAVRPAAVACDAHPDYRSTRWAEAQEIPILRVQHHEAHVLACMAENGLEPPVLGVAWDGTGYGWDATIWGGEFLLVTEESITRFAHLRAFRLPGGEAAIREPRRAALGLLNELMGEGSGSLLSSRNLERSSDPPFLHDDRQGEPYRFLDGCRAMLDAFGVQELRLLGTMLSSGLQSPWTSSVGRLFDAVASLLGLCQCADFEGQAAMALEFAAEGVSVDAGYPFDLVPLPAPASVPNSVGKNGIRPSRVAALAPGCSDAANATIPLSEQKTGSPAAGRQTAGGSVLDWRPMVHQILTEISAERPAAVIAARFHQTLAAMVAAAARAWGGETVVLTGGCFQNRRLLEQVVIRLREEGFRPYWHRQVPTNDGGLALGQLAAAGRIWKGKA